MPTMSRLWPFFSLALALALGGVWQGATERMSDAQFNARCGVIG